MKSWGEEERSHEVWDDVRKKVLKNLPCFECLGRGWVAEFYVAEVEPPVTRFCSRCAGTGVER